MFINRAIAPNKFLVGRQFADVIFNVIAPGYMVVQDNKIADAFCFALRLVAIFIDIHLMDLQLISFPMRIELCTSRLNPSF